MATYRMRALDGREFGPVETDTLHRWIREGRLVPSMLVEKDGNGDWRPARSFEDLSALFADAGGASASGPGAILAPIDGAETPRLVAAADPNLDVGYVFAKAWGLFEPTFALQALVYWLISGTIMAGTGGLGVLVTGPLMLGMAACALRRVDGGSIRFEQMFDGFKRFADALVANLLVQIAILVGTICCILPGIYVLIRLGATNYALADRARLTGVDALQDSWAITQDRFGSLLMVGIVSLLVLVLGFLACFVGLLVAWPVVLLAGAVVYRELVPRGVVEQIDGAAPATA